MQTDPRQLKLPELGEGVHEGELSKWRVKPGDTVTDDQPICDVMTDKATVELPSPVHGVVRELLVKEGETVKIGQPILTYEGIEKPQAAGAPRVIAGTIDAKQRTAAATPPPPPRPTPESAARPAAAPEAPEMRPSSEHVTAAPATRRLAREAGVDLQHVQGTGPGGRILKQDVQRTTAPAARSSTESPRGAAAVAVQPVSQTATPRLTPVPPESAPLEQRVPMMGLRKRIAEHLRQSADHVVAYTYVEEADATALVRMREEAKEVGQAQGIKVTYLPFVMKAMVAALRRYPLLNSMLDEQRQEIVYRNYFNIGLSVETDEGLVAPVVFDVDRKSVFQLARDIDDIVTRSRAKQLRPEDFAHRTITLTNAGSIGGLFATPVINYPDVAIVGFNKISKKPTVVPINGVDQVKVRHWTYFSISLDHRVVDGAVAAQFMKEFIRFIERPSLLYFEGV